MNADGTWPGRRFNRSGRFGVAETLRVYKESATEPSVTGRVPTQALPAALPRAPSSTMFRSLYITLFLAVCASAPEVSPRKRPNCDKKPSIAWTSIARALVAPVPAPKLCVEPELQYKFARR